MTNSIQILDTPVILTTGIYDLLKDHIRRKKLSKTNEAALEAQLKKARQVLRKDLPADVVTVDTLVTVKDLETGETQEYKFVGPDSAKKKNGTVSILSPMGIAMIGYPAGAVVEWEFNEEIKKNQIIRVTPI
ncbi:regulator of nucleoside diphosphate kinase [Pedobacter africanus]|uniref:Regulator of nucleoside diphosphate kinase n=1 Tax=Pedobacter africanus TaxID=151894 RepID=A0ACC6L514_9SPHI|nr:GreA/GreB family elongation factor [Pedobacter africanus]MDR6786597.1 regulator of nucleoside diphosphate kinase [Pedobacter africanus]